MTKEREDTLTLGAKSLLLARAFLHRSAGSSFFADPCPAGCACGDCGIPSLISFQVPAQVARLGACFFKDDVEAFLEAIPEDRDLSGVLRRAKTDEERVAISRVADLYRERAPGDDPRWREATASAASAARVAYAAAYASAYAAAVYAYASAARTVQKTKLLGLLEGKPA